MRLNFLLCIVILFNLISCTTRQPISPLILQFFNGRDDGQSLDRPQLYQAHVPAHWKRQDPLETESLIDTTKAICEFYIHENNEFIRITIHTFPILQGNTRIPPQAQIHRWKGQFEELDLISSQTLTDSHGGFSGLFFEGQGIIQDKITKVMGWSMQLASVYERQLSQGKKRLDFNKKADYTIKASGPTHLINKHRLDILAFARSFELIDELPNPL